MTLIAVSYALPVLGAFPVWGPVLAVASVVLLVAACEETWGHREDTGGDGVPPVVAGVPVFVPGVGDKRGTGAVPRAVTCGDSSAELSPDDCSGGS
ncbi:hypothetical protein [Streptomyces sp. CA-253872]|uniref:hypothetical protein n=1 Tax=Streptomyces sp. CA-253872 TaxID=3240067 RepID=UPI003D94BDAB